VSVEEAVEQRALWEHSARNVSPFYPQNKGIKGIEELAKRKPPVTHWHWRTLGHSMDFSLRPGESLTRYWKGQGRWRMSEAWRNDGTLKIVKEEPAGPKTGDHVSANNTYGNAEWVYEPTLSSKYADFEEGVYRRSNIELDESGLTLGSAGEAWAEWRVQTPYIIVGQPNDLLDPDDDGGAVVAALAGQGALSLSVSTDQGRTWEQAWSSEGGTVDARVDLTDWTAGRYEYHLRLALRGEPGASRLTSICITTWAQLAPMSLPRLKEGANRLQFLWGDRHGLATEAAAVEPFLGDRSDDQRADARVDGSQDPSRGASRVRGPVSGRAVTAERFLGDRGDPVPWDLRVDGPYDPSDRTSRARGPVTLPVDALEGSKIRWLHIGGSFNTGRPRGRPEPDRILYSTAPEGPWRAIREAVPPPWNDHWYYNAEVDVLLDEPASRLWVRLEPASAVNAVRVYPHCEPEGASQEGPLLVTHAFRIAGELTGETRRLEGPGIYEIECPGEPENVYVKMMVPPRARASALPSS
jgi:hypothetical protein